MLAASHARRSNNIEIALKALDRIINELNAPEKDRVSFRRLDSDAKQLIKTLPDDPKYDEIKAAVQTSSLRSLERVIAKDAASPRIRTMVSTLGRRAAESEEALNDLEKRVFQAADQADTEKAGWIYQLHWYWKWLVRHGKTDHLQRSLSRYDAKFTETIPLSTDGTALDWQIRLPVIIAENYIHAGQLPDAQRWLSRLSNISSVELRYKRRASERLAEQTLLKARAYLAAIALQAGRYEQASDYANEIIEWHPSLPTPMSKSILAKIAPALNEKTVTNAMEAALAVKDLVNGRK